MSIAEQRVIISFGESREEIMIHYPNGRIEFMEYRLTNVLQLFWDLVKQGQKVRIEIDETKTDLN